MLIDIVTAIPHAERTLDVQFADGVRGTVNLDSIITTYDGVVAPLLDESFFRRVSVNPELGTITWPNGADLAPEVLYELIVRSQRSQSQV